MFGKKNGLGLRLCFHFFFLFSLERKKKEKSSRTFNPYPARTCPRFPGKCSAHRALDFLQKSLGLEKTILNPCAAAQRH